MTRTTRTSLSVLVTAAGLLALPGPAHAAAVRHAAPAGFGAACSNAQPCTLSQAMNGASAGDEIVLRAGAYSGTSLGSRTKRLHVRGETPTQAPTITLTQPQALGECGLELGGGTLRDLRLHNVGVSQAVCADGDLVAERVAIWTDGLGGTGLAVDDADTATLRSTSVVAAGDVENAVQLSGVRTATLDHVSIQSAGSGLVLGQPSDNGTTDVTASFIRGVLGDDIGVFCDTGQSHVITTSYSAFNTIGDDCTHLAAGGDVRSDFALFEPFGQGALRPSANSSLVDAAPVTAAGELDIDGDPRTLGAKADIGADERYHEPAVSTANASAVGSSTAELSAYVNRKRADVSVWVEYFADPASQHKILAALDSGSTFLGQRAAAQLAGLEPATTYTARVIVTNGGGQTVTTPPVTFTTDAEPAAGGATGGQPAQPGTGQPAPGPGAGQPSAPGGPQPPRCTLTAKRTGGVVKLRGRCDKAGTLKVKLSRSGGRKALRRTLTIKRSGKFSAKLSASRVTGIAVQTADREGNATAFARLRLKRA